MKPLIALTLGDVCGIGPEITARLLTEPETYVLCRPVVFGDPGALRRAAAIIGAAFEIRRLEAGMDLAELQPDPDTVFCVDPGLGLGDVPFGIVDPRAGHGAFEFLRLAVEAAMAGSVRALVTAPLSKEALHAAGHVYPGHTEILAELTNTRSYAMMLATPQMKVIHLTTHVGLLEAVRRITPERTHQVVRLAHETLLSSGIAAPRIAVCGINPHAGENGLFGEGEESEKLVPGIERARAEGIDVTGPYPADTLFFRAVRGDFDVVVACYHDQGHAPVKVLSLDEGVNITVGLKGGIIRTSVDHGTAFDIAGTGSARHDSLKAALRYAVELAPATQSAVDPIGHTRVAPTP